MSASKLTWLKQQAFNIRIQDSGTEDREMDDLNLPKVTFGLPIPQVLSDTEKTNMKTAVNTFMGTRFSVSCVYHLLKMNDIFCTCF